MLKKIRQWSSKTRASHYICLYIYIYKHKGKEKKKREGKKKGCIAYKTRIICKTPKHNGVQVLFLFSFKKQKKRIPMIENVEK